MHIELIESREQFDALEDDWTALYRQDPSANVFMSWCWLKQLYDRRPEPVCILAVRMRASDQNHAAFLPLRHRLLIDRKRSRFVISYALAGNDWADQTGLLCNPDNEQEVIEVVTSTLAQMSWRSLSFFDMSMSENRYARWLAQFSRLGYSVESQYLTDNDGATRLDIAPCVTLPDTYEGYLKNLSANTRQRLRRFERTLESSDELKIDFSNPAMHEQNLTWFVHFWKKRWLASKGSRTDILAHKYRKILEQGLEDGNLILALLYQSEKPVAMIACYVDETHQTVSFFVAARDRDFNVVPGGLLLHSYMIRWAIANGYRRYHLLRGNEPYKYSLGGVDEPVYSLRVRRTNAVEKTHFLPIECRAEALEQLIDYDDRLEHSQKHRLYSQLLECWPNDVQTLTHYKSWLMEIGEHDHANSIHDALCKADTVCTPAPAFESALVSPNSDSTKGISAKSKLSGSRTDSTGIQAAEAIRHEQPASRKTPGADLGSFGLRTKTL